MARPKKDIPPSRGHKFTIRLSPEEDELLERLSHQAKMSRSQYLRSLLSGRTPSIKYEIVFNSKEILKIFANLSNIAGNLNQIAHHLNAGGGWNDEMRDELTEHVREIRQMRKDLKEITGGYRGDC